MVVSPTLYMHAIAICIFISIFVYFQNPRKQLNIVFMFMSLSFAFWMLSDIGLQLSRNVNEAHMWIKLFSFWNVSVSLLLHFTLIFTEKTRLRKKAITYIAIYVPCVVFCGLSLWKSFMSGSPIHTEHGWVLTSPRNLIYYSDILWSCIAAAIIIGTLVRFYFTTKETTKKKQVKYVALGFIFPICFGFASIFISMVTGIWKPEATTFPFFLTCCFIGYGMWKHRLFVLTPAIAADKIISTMTDGLLIVNDDGTIQTVNDALCNMLGYKKGELIGIKSERLFADISNSRPMSDKTWFYNMQTSGNICDIETSFSAKNGNTIPVSLSASTLKDKKDVVHGMVFICRDITDRKNAEAALRAAHDELETKVTQRTAQLQQANERLAVTLSGIGDGVITTDIHGKIILINNVAELLTGCGRESIEGKHIDDCVYIINERNKKRVTDILPSIISSRRTLNCEDGWELVSKDGIKRLISGSAAPINNAQNEIIGMVLVLHDMTDHKILENELFKTRKLESMGILAEGIAGDFSNILSEIATHLFTAKIHLKPYDESYKYITEAEAAAFRASRLTKQLLTFSISGAPVKERTSIKRLIEDAVGFCLSGSTTTYQLDLPDDLYPVEIDRGQIDQVINNLVVNADQAMVGGGTIAISAHNTVIDQAGSSHIPSQIIHASQMKEGVYVCISVRDEGAGISKEHIEKIFDPYFTTKENRNGLGLAAAYSIVKKHEGYITVDSKIGRGTTFCLFLPALSVEEKREEDEECAVTHTTDIAE